MGIPEAMARDGALYAYDIALPELDKMYTLVENSRVFLEKEGLNEKYGLKHTVGYGHVGDGNLHINVSAEKFDHGFSAAYEPWLWKEVKNIGGSISAEHGIGCAKTDVIHFSKSPEALEMMWSIKKAMDPKGILNPYKVICPQA